MESATEQLKEWQQENAKDVQKGNDFTWSETTKLLRIATKLNNDLEKSEKKSQSRLDTIGDAMSEIDRLTRIIASSNQLLATAHLVTKDRPCAKYLIGIRRPELREYECPICEALRNDHFFTGWVVVEKHIEHAPE